MEAALTYVSNNNYLGRNVINNSGAFTAHGPLNGAFAATMDAGLNRKWSIKTVVIQDNATVAPTYPNNVTVRWYGSNDNSQYTLLFESLAASGERTVTLPEEVNYRYLRIQHDVQPANQYSLSNAAYASNSVVMKSIKSLTPTGTVNHVAAKYGSGVQASGNSTLTTDIAIGSLSAWTISCHANNLGSGGYGSIFGATNGAGFIPKFLLVMGRLEAGKMVLHAVDSSGITHSGSIDLLPDNNFHHIAVTYSNNTLSLYIDGVFMTSIAVDLSPVTATLKLLGEGENYAFYNGVLDQVRVFNRALNETEIRYLVLESITPADSGERDNMNFDASFTAGQRINLAPNSNTIGAEI